MNRLELLILATLNQCKATFMSSAMSIYEIKNYTNMAQSITTMHRYMNDLLDKQYIKQGLKDSKSNTYYITQQGQDFIKEMGI